MKTLRRGMAWLLTLALLLAVLPLPALAADSETANVVVSVTYGQTEARTMLELINEFRTGDDAWAWNSDDTEKVYYTDLEELTYSYTLEAAAMQRAAEIALSYSHTRPNGTSCFTIDIGTWSTRGENIAAGYNSLQSAQSAFTAWAEEDEDYSGQGHRRNMLSADYTAVGIGYASFNGATYWVQEFSDGDGNTTIVTANDSTTEVTVEVLLSEVTVESLSASESSLELSEGDTVSLPTVTAAMTMTNTWPSNRAFTVTPETTWSIADSAIATLSGDSLTGAAAGETTLTGSALGQTLSIPVTVTGETENPFTDVSSDAYYYDAVLWAYSNGITSGITATTFCPLDSCTRAQAMTFLWRAKGEPEPTSSTNPFSDVSENTYYYKAVLWAYENGITSGAGTHNGTLRFDPDASCTRGQIVTFLWRAEGEPEPESTENPFTDVSDSNYYYKAVLWAYQNGITTGRTGTTFCPTESCTRAQIVTFLYRDLAE